MSFTIALPFVKATLQSKLGRSGRESNLQVPVDPVIYKITGLDSSPTAPHTSSLTMGNWCFMVGTFVPDLN
jgi:hypothetical protein